MEISETTGSFNKFAIENAARSIIEDHNRQIYDVADKISPALVSVISKAISNAIEEYHKQQNN